jgi:hypothetical protein
VNIGKLPDMDRINPSISNCMLKRRI